MESAQTTGVADCGNYDTRVKTALLFHRDAWTSVARWRGRPGSARIARPALHTDESHSSADLSNKVLLLAAEAGSQFALERCGVVQRALCPERDEGCERGCRLGHGEPDARGSRRQVHRGEDLLRTAVGSVVVRAPELVGERVTVVRARR